jgi:hypothetical protein
MNKKLIIGISSAIILVLIITLVYLFYFKTENKATLFITPQNVKGAVGQFITVNISISNVDDLYGWQIRLEWNPQILNFSSVSEGDFLKKQGQTFFSHKLNETGYLILDCTLIGDLPGVSGSGTLASVKFYVKKEGTSQLQLSETVLVNSSEDLIPHAIKNGQFST